MTLAREIVHLLEGAGEQAPGFRASEVGLFADLCWQTPPDKLVEIRTKDPAVLLETDTRYVVLQRHPEEIRFCAGPAPVGSDVTAETPQIELGILSCIAEAAVFVQEWLGGTPIKDITVPWTVPSEF